MSLERKDKLLIGLCIAAAALVVQLFCIQVSDKSSRDAASNQSTVRVPIYPNRGVIRDRNGKGRVGNKLCYDVMVPPKTIGEFDTLALCRNFGVDSLYIRERFKEYRRNMRRIGYQSVVLLRQLSPEKYTAFAELQAKGGFEGFWGQARTIREYPYNAGGNLLGYVSEVDADYISRHPGEYRPGDYAGRTGLEAAREKELRGVKGEHIYLRNSRNQIEGPYKNGEEDVEAIPGKDITTTIDAELQHYGQTLMQNKVGSLVAIEPATGEILALVSSPGIDVDQLADIGSHYKEIAANPYKPMFNRAVQASYPPGSCFKVVNGLIGLQEGVITPESCYPCSMGYHFGNHKLGCHAHRSPLNLEESIMMSCNAYYCYVLKALLENRKYSGMDESMKAWDDYVYSFGFGRPLGSDFPAELKGNIPTPEYYNRIYGRGHWKANTIISISIGQGEIGCTPLHLANFCATVANRGWYITPHIVKDSEDISIDPKYHERNYTLVDTTHFPKVVKGMYRAVNSGFGSGGTASIAAVPGLEICGKTGTAQNPHGADNSVFMCFAPMDNPKIAVVAYIENGGFGATWAAPIASLLVESYLNGEISEERKYLEKRMLEGNLMDRVRIRK